MVRGSWPTRGLWRMIRCKSYFLLLVPVLLLSYYGYLMSSSYLTKTSTGSIASSTLQADLSSVESIASRGPAWRVPPYQSVNFVESLHPLPENPAELKHVKLDSGLSVAARVVESNPNERRGDQGTMGKLSHNPYPRKNAGASVEINYDIYFHLDLKGAIPKVQFFKDILTLAHSLGIKGVVIEWEDSFPFTGTLKGVVAKNHYTMEEVREILNHAKRIGLRVIPLVQTLGHLEFVLKHSKFKESREVPNNPQALCPSRNTSIDIVYDLLDQIMAVHGSEEFGDLSEYLHMGCDEVFHLGECDLCRVKTREELYFAHVEKVARAIRSRYRKIPIIWDDMLRQFSTTAMMEHNLGQLVEPMVWVYAEDVYRFVTPMTWEGYAQVFQNVWGASAFKGAYGETLMLPPVDRHASNNLAWRNLLSHEGSRFKRGVSGLLLTGWQRYDHYAVLCELLPVSIPSLVFSAIVVQEGNMGVSAARRFRNVMGCNSRSSYRGTVDGQAGGFQDNNPIDLQNDRYLFTELTMCTFLGSDAFRVVRRLSDTMVRYNELMADQRKGWFQPFNVKHNYTAPSRVEEMKWQFISMNQELSRLMEEFRDVLLKYFDESTVKEYLEQKIWPDLKPLRELIKLIHTTESRESWEARPLPADPEFAEVYAELPSPGPTAKAERDVRKSLNEPLQ